MSFSLFAIGCHFSVGTSSVKAQYTCKPYPEFTITGSGFASGATVVFEPTSGGSNVTANSVTVNSNTNITAVVNDRSTITEANDPYNVKITNVSGLSAALGEGLQVNSSPAFSVAAGSLGSFIDGNSDISAQIYTYLKTETYFSDAVDV